MQDHVTLGYYLTGDGVQDMPPQNTVPWHSEYLKLKESEKWHVQKGFSYLPQKQVIEASCEMYQPYAQRKGEFLSLKTKGNRDV